MKANGKYDEAVLDFVSDFWERNFHSPSLREIMEATGCPSTAHMQIILKKLEQQGKLRYAGISRSIIPTWVVVSIIGAKYHRENITYEIVTL